MIRAKKAFFLLKKNATGGGCDKLRVISKIGAIEHEKKCYHIFIDIIFKYG